jgi:hypothetical protein
MVSIEQAGRTDLEQNDEKEAPARRELSPAAQRALAEAEARREALRPETLPPERGGRGGKEPVRYGDWEVKGLAVDF